MIQEATQTTKQELDSSLDPLVEEWFYSKFSEYSLSQKFGVLNILHRKNILISAPTGGTKTLTAFFGDS